MKRYIKTDKYKCIDTHKLVPHMECYIIKDNKLYVEQISGHIFDLGTIIIMKDNNENMGD